MSIAEATATGLVLPFDNSGCRIARLRNAPAGTGNVHWSPQHGTVSIQGWAGLENA